MLQRHFTGQLSPVQSDYLCGTESLKSFNPKINDAADHTKKVSSLCLL